MQTYPLILENGHLFVALPEGSFLFDTGAPTSFGKAPQVAVDEQSFNLPPSYMGLTAETLSAYVSRETHGILGGDILNQFDILIDVPQSRICFSKTPLECAGEELTLEEFMAVPILQATIAGESVRMFFDTPLCQRDVRQLHLDIFVPMGGEWSSEGAQTILGSRSREAHRGRACAR